MMLRLLVLASALALGMAAPSTSRELSKSDKPCPAWCKPHIVEGKCNSDGPKNEKLIRKTCCDGPKCTVEEPHLLTVVLQYFNMSRNIRLLERWKDCPGVELLVNVDSRFQSDLKWLNTSADNVVFSRNIHEIRAYNKLASLARSSLIAFVQDDRAPPKTCAYLSNLRQMYATDESLALVGMNIATTTPWNFGNHVRYQNPKNWWWHGSGFKADYAACVDIGPLVARKRDFFMLGMFDEKFSAPGQGGVGLDFDLSTRAWLSNRSVAVLHATTHTGIVYPDGRNGRKKAAYYDKSPSVRNYVSQRFRSYANRYEWITARVSDLNSKLRL